MENQFIIQTATAEEGEVFYKKIKEYNSEKVSLLKDQKVERICKVIKDSQGKVIAGTVSFIYHNLKSLYVDLLWVKEEYRKFRYGTMILENIEKEALEKGAYFAHLDTLGFQAKDFYVKKGYEVFAVLDECALNNKMYYMKKNLSNVNMDFKTNVVIENGTDEELGLIDDGIVGYNAQQVPFTNEQAFYDIDKVIKDSEGNIIAGIATTIMTWQDLCIHGMWASEDYLDENLKGKLLNEVEMEVKERGGNVLIHKTFDGETKDVYVKNGYEVYGILEDYLVDCKAYYLKKVI
jgi:GNAT superfamily N-acetyltransferase